MTTSTMIRTTARRALFSDRIRFNHGYHDGAHDGARLPMWHGQPHFDSVYEAGYTAGKADKLAGNYREDSTPGRPRGSSNVWPRARTARPPRRTCGKSVRVTATWDSSAPGPRARPWRWPAPRDSEGTAQVLRVEWSMR